MKLLSKTQITVGRPIDSAYINNKRVAIQSADGKFYTVLIPYGMTVAAGDSIEFQNGYVTSPELCTYVPNLAIQRPLNIIYSRDR